MPGRRRARTFRQHPVAAEVDGGDLRLEVALGRGERAAGVLHRAAFGPREAASGGLNGKARRPTGEGRGNAITQIAGWLRDNL